MKNSDLKEAYFIRKLCVFILLTFLLTISVSISANNEGGNPTTEELSITKELKSVREILQDIEKNSDYLFIYQDIDLQLDREIAIDINKRPINDVLDELFASQIIRIRLLINKSM